MNKLDGMFVYDVDDLQSVATDNAGERKKEAERAEKINGKTLTTGDAAMLARSVLRTVVGIFYAQC